MKKILLLILLCILATGIFSREYEEAEDIVGEFPEETERIVSEVPEETEYIVNEAPVGYIALPLSLSFQIPFDEFNAISSAAGVFRRINVDFAVQFMGIVGPVLSIGFETGLSATLSVISSLALLGIPAIISALSAADGSDLGASYLSTHAVHLPFRFVFNYRVDEITDIEYYSGVQLNTIFSPVQLYFDITVDVGTRFNFKPNVFFEVAYSIRSILTQSGFFDNALKIGVGYKFYFPIYPI